MLLLVCAITMETSVALFNPLLLPAGVLEEALVALINRLLLLGRVPWANRSARLKTAPSQWVSGTAQQAQTEAEPGSGAQPESALRSRESGMALMLSEAGSVSGAQPESAISTWSSGTAPRLLSEAGSVSGAQPEPAPSSWGSGTTHKMASEDARV